MRINFIEDKDTQAVFFPDSLRFYEINNFTKQILRKIIENKEDKDVENETGASKEGIAAIKKLIASNEKEIEITSNVNDKVLGKLVLNVTNKCNLACRYCYANGGNYCSEENIMDEDFAVYILEKFYERYEAINTIQLFGGEPTLNLKAIERVCRYIDERFKNGKLKEKPFIGLVSNGTLVNEQLISIINNYNLKVTVSIDGPAIVNDKMRVYKDGRGTTEKITENIKLLKQRTTEPSQVEATYNINHVKENIKVIDIVKFIKDEFNIDSVHIVPASGNEEADFILKDRKPFIDSVDDVFMGMQVGDRETYSLVNRILTALKKRTPGRYFCEAGVCMYSVSTKGDIYPCFMFTDIEEQKMGNIKDDNCFESEAFNKKTKKLVEFNKFENQDCKTCFINKICTGCLGANYFETGDIHKASKIDCDMKRSMTEKVILNIIKARKNKTANKNNI